MENTKKLLESLQNNLNENKEPTEYILTLEGKNKRQWSLTEAQFNEFQLMFEESELINF